MATPRTWIREDRKTFLYYGLPQGTGSARWCRTMPRSIAPRCCARPAGTAAGIELGFLPPYSPELNDIKPIFSRAQHQEMPIRTCNTDHRLIPAIYAAFRAKP